MNQKDALFIIAMIFLLLACFAILGYVGAQRVEAVNGKCEIGFWKFCWQWSKTFVSEQHLP